MEIQERDWSEVKRSTWWIKYLGGVIAGVGLVLGCYKWILTRPSYDDIKIAIEAIDLKKVDKDVYEINAENTSREFGKQQKTLDNVNDNLIRLLEYSDIKPKRVKRDE
jgi:hypothetical protein